MPMLKQVGFIRKCGRDVLGNTAPKCVNPDGTEGRSDPYTQDGVDVVYFNGEGIMLRREICGYAENGQPEFTKTLEEALEEEIKQLAGDRPWFIGTEKDLPKWKQYRDAYVFSEKGAKPRVTISLPRSRKIAKQRVYALTLQHATAIQNPLDPPALNAARQTKLREFFAGVDFSPAKKIADIWKLEQAYIETLKQIGVENES